MGRADRKRRSRADGDTSSANSKKNKESRWATELKESLDILDSWADVDATELIAVHVQLESIFWMRAEVIEREAKRGVAIAGDADPSSVPWDRLVAALENGCRHTRQDVRASAWEACVECCLIEPELRDALERSNLHGLAWAQLGAAVPEGASEGLRTELPSATLLIALFSFLQMTCEASESAAASVTLGELAALVKVAARLQAHGCNSPTDQAATASALELLVVLSDPTASFDEGDALPGGAAACDSVGATLAALGDWRLLVMNCLRRGSTTTSNAQRVLAASLVLNVSSAVRQASGGAIASAGDEQTDGSHPPNTVGEGPGTMASLRPMALDALAATVKEAANAASGGVILRQGVPTDVPPGRKPPDSAMVTALEALCNVFIAHGDKEEKEEEEEERQQQQDGEGETEAAAAEDEEEVARTRRALRPAELLLDLFRALPIYLAPPLPPPPPTTAGGGGSSSSSAPPPAAAGGDEAAASAEGVAMRAMRCVGALLSSSPNLLTQAALAHVATAVWQAASKAASPLPLLSAAPRLELLQILSLLSARCSTDEGATPIALPLSAVQTACRAAIFWLGALKRSSGGGLALAAAVSLLGQLLPLALGGGGGGGGGATGDGAAASAERGALVRDVVAELSSWVRPWAQAGGAAATGAAPQQWEGALCGAWAAMALKEAAAQPTDMDGADLDRALAQLKGPLEEAHKRLAGKKRREEEAERIGQALQMLDEMQIA